MGKFVVSLIHQHWGHTCFDHLKRHGSDAATELQNHGDRLTSAFPWHGLDTATRVINRFKTGDTLEPIAKVRYSASGGLGVRSLYSARNTRGRSLALPEFCRFHNFCNWLTYIFTSKAWFRHCHEHPKLWGHVCIGISVTTNA